MCVPLEDRYLYNLLEVNVCAFRGQVLYMTYWKSVCVSLEDR